MESGDEHDQFEEQGSSGRKKKYHRHTPYQIQELEAMFKVCPHPDEKQRMQLSRELGLDPRQIKFWFQNRRTQMKTQIERADNCTLRAENDRIRCENIAMMEALKNIICPSCGGAQQTIEDHLFDEQKLRMENARLKEELERISSIVSRYLGRPITQLPPIEPISLSSVDLSNGGFGNQGGIGPSLNYDMLNQGSIPLHYPALPKVSELDKTVMVNLANNAVEEVTQLVQTNEPLWVSSEYDQGEFLHLETYNKMFPRPDRQLQFPHFRIEGSRDSVSVPMNSTSLVEIFMDTTKWLDTFSTIVTKARTIEIILPGLAGSRIGSLVLMYEEIQVLSPVVPTREFYFLRYSQQIEPGSWVIADVSIDYPIENKLDAPCIARKLPSGCLIQDMPNGFAKITWIEHMEIEEKKQMHIFFKYLVGSGIAFGAQRWIANLQRMCEKYANLIPISEASGKKNILKLAQRMVSSFCANISSSNGYTWTAVSELHDVGIRVTVHKSLNNDQPDSIVLAAATSVWLPVSVERVFKFLTDEKTRTQWDVLSSGNSFEEFTHIASNARPGNRISLLRGLDTSQNMFLIQESCIDKSGCVIVYSPIDMYSVNILINGEDPTNAPLLPSGFTIVSDGKHCGEGTSTSYNPPGSNSGSIITIMYQILLSSLPSPKLSTQTISTVSSLITSTINQIKVGVNCNTDA